VFEEMDAKLFANELETNEFDIIINDLFSEQESPPFIHSNSFLRNVFRGLKPKGVYFANTISNTFEFTHGTMIEKIGYDVQRFTKVPQGISNIVYEVVKD
jgi:spermidine synthase